MLCQHRRNDHAWIASQLVIEVSTYFARVWMAPGKPLTVKSQRINNNHNVLFMDKHWIYWCLLLSINTHSKYLPKNNPKVNSKRWELIQVINHGREWRQFKTSERQYWYLIKSANLAANSWGFRTSNSVRIWMKFH